MGRKTHTLAAEKTEVEDLDMSPDGRTVATALADNTKLLHVQTGEQEIVVQGRTMSVAWRQPFSNCPSYPKSPT